MQFSAFCSHYLPLTLQLIYQHPILKRTELTPSLTVTDQVSHPYKTRDRTIALPHPNARPREVLKIKI
jgi:hypothetical protein